MGHESCEMIISWPFIEGFLKIYKKAPILFKKRHKFKKGVLGVYNLLNVFYQKRIPKPFLEQNIVEYAISGRTKFLDF